MFLYKANLEEDSGKLTTTDGSNGMNYARSCSFTQRINHETYLCEKCPQGQAATQWMSQFCVSGEVMDEACQSNPESIACFYSKAQVKYTEVLDEAEIDEDKD